MALQGPIWSASISEGHKTVVTLRKELLLSFVLACLPARLPDKRNLAGSAVPQYGLRKSPDFKISGDIILFLRQRFQVDFPVFNVQVSLNQNRSHRLNTTLRAMVTRKSTPHVNIILVLCAPITMLLLQHCIQANRLGVSLDELGRMLFQAKRIPQFLLSCLADHDVTPELFCQALNS